MGLRIHSELHKLFKENLVLFLSSCFVKKTVIFLDEVAFIVINCSTVYICRRICKNLCLKTIVGQVVRNKET